MKNTKEKKTERLELRLTKSERELVENMATKLNKSHSQLLLDAINSETDKCVDLYNLPVMNHICDMSDILINVVPLVTKDQDVIKKCKEAGEGIWHYLK